MLETNSMHAGDQFHAPLCGDCAELQVFCVVQDDEPELEETFLINITSAYLISDPSIRLPLCNASNTSSSAAQIFINSNDHPHGLLNFASDRRVNACKHVTFLTCMVHHHRIQAVFLTCALEVCLAI